MICFCDGIVKLQWLVLFCWLMENTSEFLGKSCSHWCAGWGLKNNGIVVAKGKSSNIFVDWACCLLMMLFQWIAWINQTLRLKYFIKMQVKGLNNCRRSPKVTNILDLSFMSLSLEKVPMVLVWWSSKSCVWSWMITIWVLRGSCEFVENHLWLYHEEKSVHVTYEIDINKGDIVIGW